MEDFTYLGSILSSDKSVESEVSARITKAASVLGRLNNIWHNPLVSRFTKMRTFHASVTSVLLDSKETWAATTTTLRKLDVIESKGLQKIGGLW